MPILQLDCLSLNTLHFTVGIGFTLRLFWNTFIDKELQDFLMKTLKASFLRYHFKFRKTIRKEPLQLIVRRNCMSAYTNLQDAVARKSFIRRTFCMSQLYLCIKAKTPRFPVEEEQTKARQPNVSFIISIKKTNGWIDERKSETRSENVMRLRNKEFSAQDTWRDHEVITFGL